MSAKNGGPAFPSHGSMGEVTHEGMSLRDWFAGQALACLKHEGRLKKRLLHRSESYPGAFSEATVDHFASYPNTESVQAHQWNVKSSDASEIAADAYAIADAAHGEPVEKVRDHFGPTNPQDPRELVEGGVR